MLNWTTSLGGRFPIYLTRMNRYALTGIIAIIIDYGILAFLVEILQFYYLAAVATAYTIAHSLYYLLSRKWAFKGTKSEIKKAYFYFIASGITSLFMTIIIVGALTEIANIYYFTSRILTSAIVGIFNFIFNYFITFKMGNELKK